MAKKIEALFNKVLKEVENGSSVRAACKEVGVNRQTFYDLLNEEKERGENELADQYAYAREERATLIFEEILEIADNSGNDVVIDADGIKTPNHENIQRDRLRIDARKWMLGKMDGKRFGDKVDLTTGGDKLSISINLDEPDDSE